MQEVLSVVFERYLWDSVSLLWFGFVFFSLMALMTLIWWMLVPREGNGKTLPFDSFSQRTRNLLANEKFTGFDPESVSAERSKAEERKTKGPLPGTKPVKWGYQFKGGRPAGTDAFDLGLYHSFKGRPTDADDLAMLDGIDADRAARLHALGIYLVEQLRELSDEQLRRLSSHLEVPVETALGWKHSPSWADGNLLFRPPGWPRVPTEVEIGERANQLFRWRQENGVPGRQQDDWIVAERELFIQSCGNDVTIDRKASYVTGTGRDDFPALTPQIADELSRLGYPSRAALSAITDADKVRVALWLQARGMETDLEKVQASLTETTRSRPIDFGLGLPEFSGESVKRDSNFGILYGEKPETVDDLTAIRGIGPALEQQLNEAGVYRYQQIATWDEDQAACFGERLGSAGMIERDQWIPQAQYRARMELERIQAEPEVEPELPQDDACDGLKQQYPGEDIRVERALGVLFNGLPNGEDDLTQIKGIGHALSKLLNEWGVYRFRQIADWNDYHVWSFNRITAFPGRIQADQWVQQARELALTSPCLKRGLAQVTAKDLASIVRAEFSGEDVEIREPFGILYQSPPATQDHLQDIYGVGPILEKKLHDLGVYRFKQIANWTNEAIEEFEEELSFPDRIRRDDWVGQCLRFIRDHK